MFIKHGYDKYQKILSTNIIVSLLTLSSLFCSSAAKAQGDLFINPKRIVFEGQKRSQEITLANMGNDTARYLVSFIQIKLKDNGNFEQIEKPDSGQYFADKNLRIFPRTVTLAPKESQVIRVQVYQKETLTTGEYRSHLYFRSTKIEKPISQAPLKEDEKNVSVKLTPVFGITIPVIIRIGESTTKISISDVKLETTPNHLQKLNLRLNRTGNMSVYGDINIDYVSPSGKTAVAGSLKGISLYTPNQLRNVSIPLNVDIKYKGGKFSISYSGVKDGKAERFASTEIAL